jgi:galactonate dehydratase
MLGLRVDFHERFSPDDFVALVPRLEGLGLDWLEEPFPMGEAYGRLRESTALRIAAGELFWGQATFVEIAASGRVDVIMPDVKHVGGFGPLLDVIEATRDRVEISPHNPSGPVSTAASLHAAVLNPDAVSSIEFAFDRDRVRPVTGERIEGGRLYLADRPGWGIEPPV